MSFIPVTILTGFLGSGKSTLLNQILKDPRFGRTAIVVNEFGDIDLDGVLVTPASEQILMSTTGCLCCTIRGDVRQTLEDLADKQANGTIQPFDRVIIETTGLADPAPIIHTFMTDEVVMAHYMLAGVVATVDAINAEPTLRDYEESRKQIAVADRLVLTKTDHDIDPAAQHDLKRVLDQLNPIAFRQNRADPDFALDRLFDTTLYDVKTKSFEVQRWLQAEAVMPDHHHHDHDHHHHHHDHHHHDINRHGDDIYTFCLVFDKPVRKSPFITALRMLIDMHGDRLLRIKGIVGFDDQPTEPVVFHGVQHVFHDPLVLDAWPDQDHRSRLVFIMKGMDQQVVESYFDQWLSMEQKQLA